MLSALALHGAAADLRIAGANRSAKSGLYCAEAGVNAARSYFATNYPLWNTMFAASSTTYQGGQSSVPGYPVRGDIDGDGVADYQVTLKDNIDEFAPLANNPLRDNDLTAIMVSKCINPAMSPRTLQEIVVLNSRGSSYRYQAGHGANHAGNEN
jgi:hypothetical protein